MASHVLAAENPASAQTLVRFMLGQPLDFDPGTLSAYSNFGFNVLGRVIEHLTGKTYEQYVLDEIATPLGITDWKIGGTYLADRFPGEVRYYGPPGQAPRIGITPGEGFVPVGYGSFFLPSMDAHGGWISSAHDLARFALGVDGTAGPALLSPESVTALETTPAHLPPPKAPATPKRAHGLAFNSAEVDGGYEWSHAGALEGSNCSWIVRKPNGTALAFVFNSLPEDFGDVLRGDHPAVAGIAWGDGVDLPGSRLLTRGRPLSGATACWPDDFPARRKGLPYPGDPDFVSEEGVGPVAALAFGRDLLDRACQAELFLQDRRHLRHQPRSGQVSGFHSFDRRNARAQCM